jgi:hypothetical protein
LNNNANVLDIRSQILSMCIGRSTYVAGCKAMRYSASLLIRQGDSKHQCAQVRVYAGRRLGQHTRVVGRVRVGDQSCVISGDIKKGWLYSVLNGTSTARLTFPWWWTATRRGTLLLDFSDGSRCLIRFPWLQTLERVGKIKQAGHTQWSRYWLYIDRSLCAQSPLVFPEPDCFQATTPENTLLLASCALSLAVFPPVVVGGD